MKQIILGHHKCGTLWLSEILKRLFPEKFPAVGKKHYGFNLLAYMDKVGIETAFCVHSQYEDIAYGSGFRAIHIIRDPRDVAVSSYFSHRYSHGTDSWPELINHRERMVGMSCEDGLIADMEWSDKMPVHNGRISVLRDIEFPHRSNILVFRFERLVVETEHYLKLAFNYFDLPLPEFFEKTIEQMSFKNLSGREPGDTKDDSHMRCGKPGEWKKYFTPKVQEYFDARFGDLPRRLGYE